MPLTVSTKGPLHCKKGELGKYGCDFAIPIYGRYPWVESIFFDSERNLFLIFSHYGFTYKRQISGLATM